MSVCPESPSGVPSLWDSEKAGYSRHKKRKSMSVPQSHAQQTIEAKELKRVTASPDSHGPSLFLSFPQGPVTRKCGTGATFDDVDALTSAITWNTPRDSWDTQREVRDA
jgi:hypothetical protein